MKTKESRLVTLFLKKYKEIYEKRTKEEFHPRHLMVLYQTRTSSKSISWAAWHQWFDTLEYSFCHAHSLLEVYIDNFIHVLLSLKNNKGVEPLTEKDKKRLGKLLRLARDIKIYYKGAPDAKKRTTKRKKGADSRKREKKTD